MHPFKPKRDNRTKFQDTEQTKCGAYNNPEPATNRDHSTGRAVQAGPAKLPLSLNLTAATLCLQSHQHAQEAKQCRRKKPTLTQQRFLTVVYYIQYDTTRSVCIGRYANVQCPLRLWASWLPDAPTTTCTGAPSVGSPLNAGSDRSYPTGQGLQSTTRREWAEGIGFRVVVGGNRYSPEHTATRADVIQAATLAHPRPRWRWYVKTEKPVLNGST